MEDFSPLLNGSNVFIHAFTSLDSIWKHPNDLANIFNSSNKFQRLEVTEDNLHFIDDLLLAVEAALELNEVVVSSQAVNESSSEVGDCIEGWKADTVCGCCVNIKISEHLECLILINMFGHDNLSALISIINFYSCDISRDIIFLRYLTI